MTGISIIVVTWNCERFIEKFIDELHKSLSGVVDDYEVLILDNASSDGTSDILCKTLPKHFRLTQSTENLGFAQGNNRLIQNATYDWIALLNPDIFDYPEGFWKNIIQSMKKFRADVGFVKLRNPDGSFQDCIGDFPSPFRAFSSLIRKKKDFAALRNPTRIEVGIMAFMMTRKDVFNSIGLIDEDFHMYCEDVEWCFRASQAGKSIIYFPSLSLTHIGGASAENRWKGLRKNLIKYRSESIFIRKHHQGGRFAVLMALNLIKRIILRARMLA